MFTGIIETIGTVAAVTPEGGNVHVDMTSSLSPFLKIDQSVAHNGVCLTVVALTGPSELPTGYRVTAIQETVRLTTLGQWIPGTKVNLERCVVVGARLDGHIVQGHVDATGVITAIENHEGSWLFRIQHAVIPSFLTVPKGSVAVQGVSLTVVDSAPDGFSVAIIPYTFEHTVFHTLSVGDKVHLEFDVLGKYAATLFERSKSHVYG